MTFYVIIMQIGINNPCPIRIMAQNFPFKSTHGRSGLLAPNKEAVNPAFKRRGTEEHV